MPNHTIKQGECLSSIARKYGLADWRTIYNHPDNTDFRSRRPNPNLVFPGDEVFVPEVTEGIAECATGQQHRIRITFPKRVLNIAVESPDRTRLTNADYCLKVGSKIFEGKTDGEGRIRTDIPALALQATLTIGAYTWPLKIGHLNPIEDTDDEGISGVQGRLRNLAYDPGPIDGIEGHRTRAAIRRFQADHPPLVVDGICGPETRAALLEAHGC